MVLLIDNYDSFVHNLARYLRRLGQPTEVVRNDAVDVAAIVARSPRAIVLSPGPCTPQEAGCSLSVVRELAGAVPILGVCLGHQTIAAALGGRVVRAPQPMHGRTSPIRHDGEREFAGLPNPLVVGRYHSLVVEEATLPSCLDVSARTADGVVMGLRHRSAPVIGWQFHPESILTQHGYDLLAAFLRLAGLGAATDLPDWSSELRPPVPSQPLPSRPVTF